MKSSSNKLGFLGFMLCLFTGLDGQDPQFSQFYNSSLYYNPATVGLTQDLRISSSYRNLWSGIPGDLSTYFLSVDYQWTEKNVGLGLLVLNDNAGIHNMRTQRIELIYSYRLQSKRRLVQAGMSVFSVNMRDFKDNQFIFTDQLDPIYGVLPSSSYVSQDMERIIYPDWNIGFIYRENLRSIKATPTIGFSASHLFRPNISFMNDRVKLPIKYVFHANFLTQVTFGKDDVWKRKRAYLNPGFVYEYQNPFQTFTFGTGFDVYPFRFGMYFRNKSFFSEVHKFNSIVMHAGIIIPISLNHNLLLDYTYDSTISKLEFASGGAHELTLIYNISLPEKRQAVPCYNEWWKIGGGTVYHDKK